MLIRFTHKGRLRQMELRRVSGAAHEGGMFFLFENDFYQGTLLRNARDEWQFNHQRHGLLPQFAAFLGSKAAELNRQRPV